LVLKLSTIWTEVFVAKKCTYTAQYYSILFLIKKYDIPNKVH
jgi:hypothetical protein